MKYDGTDYNPVRGPAHDPVDHPAHYTSHPARCECGRGIDCIQITEHMGFNLGNVIKYVWRADLKGDDIEQLRKAAWYLHREIMRRTQPDKQQETTMRATSDKTTLRKGV